MKLLILALLLHNVASYQKEWRWVNKWNLPENWLPRKIPCPQDRILIGDGVVFIGNNVSATEMVLSDNSELVFGDNSEIEMLDATRTEPASVDVTTECNSQGDGVDMEFVGQPPKSWLNPLNWQYVNAAGIPDDYLTTAAPYMERIPCRNDELIFQKGNAFAVQLSESYSVKQISIDEQFTDNVQLQSHLSSKGGKSSFVLERGVDLTVETYACPTKGCLCGYDKYKSGICSAFKCPSTANACSRTVKPHGDCCQRCGTKLTFDSPSNFNMDACMRRYRASTEQKLNKVNSGNVKLFMSRMTNTKVQVLFTDLSDGEAALKALNNLHKLIQGTDSSEACSGQNILVDTGDFVIPTKKPSTGDNNKTRTIALAIILPILLLIIIVIIVIAYRKSRRSHDIPAVKFKNEELEFPGGVQDIQFATTDFSEIDIESNRRNPNAFVNPVYEVENGPKDNEIAERPFNIPTDEAPPVYTEKEVVDTNDGAQSPFREKSGMENPLYKQLKKEQDEGESDTSSIRKAPLESELDDSNYDTQSIASINGAKLVIDMKEEGDEHIDEVYQDEKNNDGEKKESEA